MLKITSLGSDIQKILSKQELEKLARETKFVQRKSPLTGIAFFYICVKSVIESGFSSLTESCAIGLEQDVIISKPSLHERFNEKAVTFMCQIFEKILSLELKEKLVLRIKGLEKFTGLYLQDATIHRLPNNLASLYRGSGGGRKGNATKGGLKTDLLYNIFGSEMSVKFRNEASSDSSVNIEEIVKDSLYLFDLGYYKLDRFVSLIKARAFFISRYKFKTNLYETKDAKEAIDVLTYVKTLTEDNETMDKIIFLGKRARVPVRLVLQRVPKEVFEEKKAKIKAKCKKKGDNLSMQRIAFCAVSAYITNLSMEEFSTKQIIRFYSIRWQIEILFKAWKSVINFRLVHPMNEHRFMCLLYGQMIWITLNMKFFQAIKIYTWNKYKVEVSELKGYKILKQLNGILKQALKNNEEDMFIEFIQKATKAMFFFGEKEHRKNRKPSFFKEYSP